MTKIPGLHRLSDGRWRLRTTRVDARGRKVERQRTLPKSVTKRMAVVELEEMTRALEVELDPRTRPAETVAEFVMRWSRERKGDFAPKTVLAYSFALERMLDSLGDIACTELRRRDVVDMLAEWGDLRKSDGTQYSQRSYSAWWRPCGMVLRDLAAEYELADPTLRVSVKRLGDPELVRETRTPTVDQMQQVLRWVYDNRPTRFVEVVVLATTGMRLGELRALQWHDVDFDARTLTVRRAFSVNETKGTKSGDVRVLPLTDRLETALRCHRERLRNAGLPGEGEAWVVASRTGAPRDDKRIRATIVDAGNAVGLGFRLGPHQLRRFVNSRMLEAGVDRAIVQSQLGHVTGSMTEHYYDPDVDARRAALSLVLESGTSSGTDHETNDAGLEAGAESPNEIRR